MKHLLKNSYVVAIISFVVLLVVFYVFKIGYTYQTTPEGKVVAKMNWFYPLGISIIIWACWKYLIYPDPPSDSTDTLPARDFSLFELADRVEKRALAVGDSGRIDPQRIKIDVAY